MVLQSPYLPEESVYKDERVLDTGLPKFFHVYHSCIKQSLTTAEAPFSNSRSALYATFAISESVPSLSDMTEGLVSSHNSPNELCLLETRARETVCTASWLNTVGHPSAQRITVPTILTLPRFAGHPILVLHGVFPKATTVGIHGKKSPWSASCFVLFGIPITFLFGLRDQRRIGFDVCLRLVHCSTS